MMSAIVYLMCALTSVICAGLLFRNYGRNKTPLLFWSSVCFSCLAVNNILLFADLVVVARFDLSILRTVPAVAGFAALVWGFTWEPR